MQTLYIPGEFREIQIQVTILSVFLKCEGADFTDKKICQY